LTAPAPTGATGAPGADSGLAPGADSSLASGADSARAPGADSGHAAGRGIGGLPLLWRASLRQMARRPGQAALAVVGVALGVAVVVAVDLASRSAGRAFELSTEAVTGRATHQIVGGPEGLPEGLFPRLVLTAGITAGSGAGGVSGDLSGGVSGDVSGAARMPGVPGVPGVVAAAPVVEAYVTLPARPGRPARLLHLLGIDPFSEGGLRPYLGAGGADLSQLLLRSGTCVLPAATAAELGLRTGDSFSVRIGGATKQLELAGVLQPAGARAGAGGESDALADLLVMDIAAAQELLGRLGRLDRIDLRLAEERHDAASQGPAGSARWSTITALLPPGAQLLPASGGGRDALAMTRAFRINLTALSLLALLCGAFLIYNTMTFSVVQRRPLLGTFRALGVTRGQVLALVLGEAAVVAVVGTAAGLALGVLLGRGLLRLVTQTINDLYFAVSVRGLSLSPASFLAGAAIGIGATLAAALAPALEATLTPPRAVLSRSLLEARLRQALPRASALGGTLLLLGGCLLALPARAVAGQAGAAGPMGTGSGLVLGFAGLGAAIVGCALLAPAATVGLMRLLRPALGALLGVRGRMAAGGVVASLSRTAVAIAALMVAVAVTVGIGVMIDSFRHTVVDWLEESLQADLYVSAPAGYGGFGGAPITPGFAGRAAAVPGVAAVHALRRIELRSASGPIRLLAVDADRRRFRGFELLEGDADDVWRRVGTGDEAMVSEPFSRRWGVRVRGLVQLPTAGGPRAFRVAGVFYDYTSDLGLVLISRRTYLRFWHDPQLSGFSIDLAPRADLGATVRLLRQALGGETLVIRSNRELERLSLEIFDRTFLITGVLRLLAGLVAAIGVLSALTALQLERAREIGVLRAMGLTPGQVWQLVTAQTGLMGLAAGLLALPVGLVLSAIMVYIINRRSFGWTIHLQIAPAVLLEALLLAVATALAAGVYPAWRMARTSPALALREE
jgi:putative ABC transport system permease protein